MGSPGFFTQKPDGVDSIRPQNLIRILGPKVPEF